MTLPAQGRAATLFVTACHPLSVGRRVVPTFGGRIQENQRVTDLMTPELRKSGQATAASLAVTFAAGFCDSAMDLSFTGIAKVVTGEARDDMSLADAGIQIQNDHGRFAGWTGGEFQEAPICVEGEMSGPNHADTAGVFGYNELIGAFGAKRQLRDAIRGRRSVHSLTYKGTAPSRREKTMEIVKCMGGQGLALLVLTRTVAASAEGGSYRAVSHGWEEVRGTGGSALFPAC